MRRPRRFHVESLEGRVVLSAALPIFGSAQALVATPAPTQSSTELNPKTLENLQSAMEGESLASATYLAYAAATQKSQLASAWETIAKDESEHFSQEAQFSGLVEDNIHNLKTVIAAETNAIKTYTEDAQQAFKAGYQDVGNTFLEFRDDETTHLMLFEQALKALQQPESMVGVPSAPPVVPATIVPTSKPAARGRTLTDIINASKDEAFASAEYTLFAQKAADTNQPQLAALFAGIARMERLEHFNELANLSALVRSDRANLRASFVAETKAANTYQQDTRQANRVGDQAVAALFAEIAGDEERHAEIFKNLLKESRTGRPD